ncbi:MAG TPA: hypothetical protein VHR41_16940 [Gemmatimonadales bacterium]|jgi:hypothetical protein|nr:hypothetical protein [Gemmatimonadales bacterium]
MQLVTRGMAGALALTLAAGVANAQVGLTSSPATVSLTATKSSTLTLSPTSGTATLASITDSSAANVFTPVTLTTAWNLTAGTSMKLVGWFATPAQAMANGTDFIPSSKVEGRVGATAFAPFTSGATGGVGVANGSLVLYSQAVGAGSFLGSRSDQLDVRLNLANTFTVAGNYTGTLNLQAVVQ